MCVCADVKWSDKVARKPGKKWSDSNQQTKVCFLFVCLRKEIKGKRRESTNYNKTAMEKL